MKKMFILFIAIVLAQSANSQEDNKLFQWPVAGKSVGEGILYRPQQYIDKELNFADLVIAAPEGSAVLSPVDGTISSYSVDKVISLVSMSAYKCDGSDLVNSFSEIVESDNSPQSKFLNLVVGIKLDDGRKIYISGLKPDRNLKQGQKIKQGDTLGLSSYWYNKVSEPSICLSISNKKGQSADPMTPFGLKSTFISPSENIQKSFLTKDEATADFMLFINALKEAYPGLYDVVTEEDLQNYIDKTIASFNQIFINVYDFENTMKRAVGFIHDSHLAVLPSEAPCAGGNCKVKMPRNHLPSIYFGWINDTLVVTRAVDKYKEYYGKEILAIDGYSADSLKKILSSYISCYDAKVKSYPEFYLAYKSYIDYFILGYSSSNDYDFKATFYDGNTVDIKHLVYKGSGYTGLKPVWADFGKINKYEDSNYQLRYISDSVAYIGLSSFELNEVELEEISNFIKDISGKAKFLIFDVRRNPGGDVDAIAKIFSHFAQKPFKTELFSKVNSNGNYSFFDNTLNYSGITNAVFPDYKAVTGKNGFYKYSYDNDYQPDSVVNFKGKLYVLTDERSFSAATLFAALTVRHHRGVVVGRETGTAYHYMNATKFADLRLPKSHVTVRIPLCLSVFDTIVNERVPYGSGVLPDYPVNLSLDEMGFTNGDSILNYTIQLIEDGKYLKDNLFAQYDEAIETEKDYNFLIYVLAGTLVVIGLLIFMMTKYLSKLFLTQH